MELVFKVEKFGLEIEYSKIFINNKI